MLGKLIKNGFEKAMNHKFPEKIRELYLFEAGLYVSKPTQSAEDLLKGKGRFVYHVEFQDQIGGNGTFIEYLEDEKITST